MVSVDSSHEASVTGSERHRKRVSREKRDSVFISVLHVNSALKK